MDEKSIQCICSGQIISSGRSDGLTDRLITTKLLDSEFILYVLKAKDAIFNESL